MSPKMEIYAGDNPLGFVISLNLHRRHLNESQRGMVAAKLANLEQGQRADRADPQICVYTQTQAAELLNVSERTVNTAKKVEQQGSPELITAVERGEASVSAAADIATLPTDQQSEIVAKGEKEILQKAKEIRAERALIIRHKNSKIF